MKAGAEIQADGRTSNLSFHCADTNLSGIGDSVRIALKLNAVPKIYAADLEYAVPIPWQLLHNPTWSLGYSQFEHSSIPSAYVQENKSIRQSLEFYPNDQLKHTLSFINTWTHIRASSAQTPLEIREQAGHFLKSYLRYVIQYDDRKPFENYPSSGILTRLTTDLTTNLFNKSARFLRQEAHFQINRLLLPRFGLLGQLDFYAGTLLKADKYDISDKFFPGGVPEFRGFETQSFGPLARGHPLGNISYLTGGLHLYPIMPGTEVDSRLNEFIRPHFFLNAGTFGDLNRHSLRQVRNLQDSMRVSCGVGLIFAYMGLRFELNYNVPLVSKDTDLPVHGVQFGFYSSR